MEGVDIDRSQTLTHFFHFFLSAGKSCLYPFLTLYFRYLGLNGFQTGIVIGVQCFSSCIFGPLWLTCSQKCRKQRLSLMFSLCVCIAAGLMLTLVPPSDRDGAIAECVNRTGEPLPAFLNQSLNTNGTDFMVQDKPISPQETVDQTDNEEEGGVKEEPGSGEPSEDQFQTAEQKTSTLPGEQGSAGQDQHKSMTTKQKPTTQGKTSPTQEKTTTTEQKTSPTQQKTSPTQQKTSTTQQKTSTTQQKTSTTQQKTSTTPQKTSSTQQKTSSTQQKTAAPKQTNPKTTTTTTLPPATEKTSQIHRLNDQTRMVFEELGYSDEEIEQIDRMDKKSFDEFMKKVEDAIKDDVEEETDNNRKKRDILGSTMNSINEKLSQWQNTMSKNQYRSFISVLVVIIVAELFSAPVERLADNLWFDFLDGLDFLERYGSQRVWSTLAMIIFPLIVTGIVDSTPCVLLSGNISHFMIHFYLFAGVMFIVVILSFCFPIFPDNNNSKKKVSRTTSIFRGCRILCTDVHAFSYVFTILLSGLVMSTIDNFLFWRIWDLGASEIYMGGALAIAAISQFVLYMLAKWMVRKLSNAGVIVVSLLALATRLVAYSFLWTPWPALLLALLHGLSHTMLWAAVENYPDFKVNPFIMDRNAKSVLSTMQQGLGYGVGSVLGGYLYDWVGFSTLYQGAAIATVAWCILFALLQKCVRHKHKVRYAKLLQAEEDQDSDEYDDDDWLEVALKHEK